MKKSINVQFGEALDREGVSQTLLVVGMVKLRELSDGNAEYKISVYSNIKKDTKKGRETKYKTIQALEEWIERNRISYYEK